MTTTQQIPMASRLTRRINGMVQRAAYDPQDALKKDFGVPQAAELRPTQEPPRIGKDGKPETPPAIPLPDHAMMRYDPNESHATQKPLTRKELDSIRQHALVAKCPTCSAFLKGAQRGRAGQQVIAKQAAARAARDAQPTTQRRAPTVPQRATAPVHKVAIDAPARGTQQAIAELQALGQRTADYATQAEIAREIFALQLQQHAASGIPGK